MAQKILKAMVVYQLNRNRTIKPIYFKIGWTGKADTEYSCRQIGWWEAEVPAHQIAPVFSKYEAWRLGHQKVLLDGHC
jgi:hypothetical protein